MKHLFLLIALGFLLCCRALPSIPPTLGFGKTLDFGAHASDFPQGMSSDASGNIYLLGYSDTADITQWYVLKFDSYGTEIYRRTVFMAHRGIHPSLIDADDFGNVWVVGVVVGTVSAADLVTIKLNPDGNIAWIRLFDAAANSAEQPIALRHDPIGFPHVVFKSTVDGQSALQAITYNAVGTILVGGGYLEKGFRPIRGQFNAEGYLVVTGTDAASRSKFAIYDPFFKLIKSEVAVPTNGESYGYSVFADATSQFEVALTKLDTTFSYTVRAFDKNGGITMNSVSIPGSVGTLSARSPQEIYVSTVVSNQGAIARVNQAGVQWSVVMPQAGFTAANSGVIVNRLDNATSPKQVFVESYDPSGTLLWRTTTNLAAAFRYVDGFSVKILQGQIHYLGIAQQFGNALDNDVIYRKYVEGPALHSVAMSTESVPGGEPASGSVKFTLPLPSNANVNLTSSNPDILAVPATTTLLAGLVSCGFQANTAFVDTNKTVYVTAQFGGVQRTAALRLLPATLTSLTMPVNSIKGGTNVAVTVHLSTKTGINGRLVSLQSSNTSLAKVPDSVLVPPGASSVVFVANTVPRGDGKVTFSATLSGVTVKADLVVVP